jgi:hypothetical protein
VFGDNNALEIGFAFTPASAPGVFVDEADFARAAELMEKFFDREREPPVAGTWNCAACGETVDAQFDICWNCEAPRGTAAIEPNVPPPSLTSDDAPSNTANSEDEHQKVEQFPHEIDSGKPDRRDIWLEVGAVLAVGWLPYFVYSFSDWIVRIEQGEWPCNSFCVKPASSSIVG